MFLCLKYLVQPSKWRVKLGIWEVAFFPVPEEIVYSFLVCYFSDKRVWYTIIFLSLSSTYGFFAIPSLILSNLELSRIELPKLTSSILIEILQRHAWLFEKFIFELDASSHNFKITYILSRKVISLKKMVVSSAKFTILVSWSLICIPLIFLLTLMKLASTSAAIMYKKHRE